MTRIQAGDFAREQRVFGKLVPQGSQHFPGAAIVLVADISNGQQDAREWTQIAPMVGVICNSTIPCFLSPETPPSRNTQRNGAAMLPMMYLLKPVATRAS